MLVDKYGLYVGTLFGNLTEERRISLNKVVFHRRRLSETKDDFIRSKMSSFVD